MEIQYDFTPDGMFTGRAFNRGVFSDILRSLNFKYPWSFPDFREVNSDEDLYNEGSKLFYTGYVQDIKLHMLYDSVVEGKSCDRCGKELNHILWGVNKRYPGLCDKCAAEMEEEYGDDIFGIPKPRRDMSRPWWIG